MHASCKRLLPRSGMIAAHLPSLARWRAATGQYQTRTVVRIAAYSPGASVSGGSGGGVRRPSAVEFKQQLKAGALKLGLFIDSGSYVVAEQASHSGYDWLLLDLQHSPVSYDQLGAMLAASATGAALPLVRVAGPGDRAGMQQSLDLGAAGVMVPSVNTASEVAQAVEYCRFPPQGVRSIFYPMRATHATGLQQYVESANDGVLIVIQVETGACLANLSDILAVPGVDAAFVGPYDLAVSMGLHQKHGFDGMFGSEEYKEAEEHVLAMCKAHGVVPGNFTSSPSTKAKEMACQGFQLLGLGNDTGLLLAAASQQLQGLAGARGPSGPGWHPQPSAIA